MNLKWDVPFACRAVRLQGRKVSCVPGGSESKVTSKPVQVMESLITSVIFINSATGSL